MKKTTNATTPRVNYDQADRLEKKNSTVYSRNSVSGNFFGSKVSYMIGSSVRRTGNSYGK